MSSSAARIVPRLGALALAAAGLLALSEASCYTPELGDNPFLCAAQEPQCPEGYSCQSGICSRLPGPGSDGGSDAAGGAGGSSGMVPDPSNCPDKDVDSMPTNDTVTNATVAGYGNSVNWAICRANDIDYYKIFLKKAASGSPAAKIRITLKFKPIGMGGQLDVIFFGGSVMEATPSMSAPHADGREIDATPMFTGTKTEDWFFFKVFAMPLVMGGGPNFYDLVVSRT